MSDSLERFVIEYSVDLKESLKRLEELQNRIDSTNKKAKSSTDVSNAFKDMAAEIKPLFGEMSLLDTVITRVGYRLMWMAPIIATLGVAVKSVMDTRKEYEAQRKLAFESGMGPMAIEQFQRQANTASGGIIGAEGARGIIQKTSNLSMQAFTNPDVMSRESLILNRLGTSAFDKGGNIKSTSKILDEIGQKLASVTQSQAVALGALANFSADEVKALRNRGAAVREASKMSEQESQKLLQQQADMEKVRNSLGRTAEQWRRIELVISSNVMPLVEDLITNTANEIEMVQQIFQTMSDGWETFVEDFKWGLQHPFATYAETQEAKLSRFFDKVQKDQENQSQRELREQDKNFNESRQAQALFSRDINLFSSAVSTFAGVIDERQAWAAWAGEVGRAAGIGPVQGQAALPTGATSSTAVPGKPVTNQAYDEIFQREADKYKHLGMTPDLLKAITRVESNFNPNAISGSDAHGLMQIIGKNFKGTGITNPYDPNQNIAAGAQLMAEYLKASGGDLRTALTMYHGGYKRENWGPLTRAYPDKVLGALDNIQRVKAQGGAADLQNPDGGRRVGMYENINDSRPAGAAPYPVGTPGVDMSTNKMPKGHTAPVAGQGRENIQLRGIQEAIAGYLGVPVEQVMQGFVNKGDVKFAREYLQMGTEREYIKNVQMSKMPGIRPNIAAEAAKNARAAAFQLNAFNKYGQDVENRARPGERDITIGQKQIDIHIDGARDPRGTAEEVRRNLLQDDVNDINNLLSTPVQW
ncbi:lytic transglycosylase [Pantoea phage Kyle]|uniref:Lytic transglycosylase n=1 Tax=Pantoea phage Kyle TaxID=2589665 RepID=A0A514A8K9_9CAUD|nr:lytic tail protein [Pantoea phage Kyle]QDH49606.1 lytic transglycosylase [Pantoea phage Kyle]